MSKMGEQPAVSQKEDSKNNYNAKAEELNKLSEEEAQEQDDEKKMEILGKKIALKKELKGLMGGAEDEAGKENTERDHEAANEENERLNAEKEAKAKEAEAEHKAVEAERAKAIEAEAKKTAQMLEEVRAKINSIDTGVLGGERKGEVKTEGMEKAKIDRAKEEEGFAEIFVEETTQLEALKSSADSASTLEDLETVFKAAQSLYEKTKNKYQQAKTEKGLTHPEDPSLNNLARASGINSIKELVEATREKLGSEATKAIEAFTVEINNDYDAVANNIEQILASNPETGNLEGLGLEELVGKLSELNAFQRKLDTIKFDIPLDGVQAITEKENNFEKKMKSLEDQGVNVRFEIGNGIWGKSSDLWRKRAKDGHEGKAINALTNLKEEAPTLISPKAEAIKQVIGKVFDGYGARIDGISAEYQKNKGVIEAEEAGINSQITQLESGKGMFNKSKVEAQIIELRKGLGKLDALKEQTRNQLKVVEEEVDRLDDKTGGAYKDKFDALARKRVQAWNSI